MIGTFALFRWMVAVGLAGCLLIDPAFASGALPSLKIARGYGGHVMGNDISSEENKERFR